MNLDFSFLSEDTAVLCREYFKTFRSANSISTYYPSIKEFFTSCGKRDISEISFGDCMQYVSYAKQMCADGKIKEAVACAKKKHLSGFFSYVAKHRHSFIGIPNNFENYFHSIPNPYAITETIKFRHVITLPELDMLTGYLTEHDPMCMAAVMFAFKMLLNGSEFLQLKFSDIFIADDDGNCAILCVTDSNGMKRYLSMPSDIYSFLTEKWLPAAGSEYIFPGKNGTISLRALRYRLNNAYSALKIGPYSFNDLRNSGISYAASQGASVNLIAKAINMKQPSHIKRLVSLSNLHFTDIGSYVNVTFNGTADGSAVKK